LKNYPNPFNSNTIIDFYITNDSKVDLKIFDIMGNLVRNLVRDRMPAGLKKINWDGTNNNREDIAAGVYFYRLIVNETLFSNKMVYLK
jgi:flagellar hook assembly protein FlgD